MDVEWSRAFDGKLALGALVEAVRKCLAPAGVTRVEWEIRRASFRIDELTYKFDVSDDRQRAEEMYGSDIEGAFVSLTVFPPEARDNAVQIHLDFDGRRTRLRAEGASQRVLERLRDSYR